MTDAPITETNHATRRPEHTVARDALLIQLLTDRPHNRHELDDLLGTTWRQTYGALCRLRHAGTVKLQRTGTRTPVWQLAEIA